MIKNATTLRAKLLPLIKEANGQENFGKMFDVSQQTVSAWLRFGYVPPHQALKLHAHYPHLKIKDLVMPKFRHLIAVSGE